MPLGSLPGVFDLKTASDENFIACCFIIISGPKRPRFLSLYLSMGKGERESPKAQVYLLEWV